MKEKEKKTDEDIAKLTGLKKGDKIILTDNLMGGEVGKEYTIENVIGFLCGGNVYLDDGTTTLGMFCKKI